jgi:hypothetical protein
VGFAPTISTGERSQTYAIDCAVTGTGYRLRLDVHIPIKDDTEIGRGGKDKRHPQQVGSCESTAGGQQEGSS